MKQGFQLTRDPVSEIPNAFDRKELTQRKPVGQVTVNPLLISDQEQAYPQLRIVTQFTVEKAQLYVIALSSFDTATLNNAETEQQLEKMLTQFFYLKAVEAGQPQNNVSIIDNFETAAERYCVARITPLTSRSISAVTDAALIESTLLTDESSCAQTALQALLSPREQEIICLIAIGLSNKQIATRLDISIWTVSAHLRRIFTKLKVDTRAAVVYQCSKLIQGWQKA